jgi:hypothetical protein
LLPSPLDDDGDGDEGEDDEVDDDAPAPKPTTAELLRGEGLPPRESPQQVVWLGVLPQNMRAVRIFQRCKPTLVVGLGGSAWLGISGLELSARLDLEGVPTSERCDVAARVDVMDRVSTQIRNAARAKGNEAPTPTAAAAPGPPAAQQRQSGRKQ